MTPGVLARTAAAIVAETLGEPVSAVKEIVAGVMTDKFQVTTTSGEDYIVRFYPKSRIFVAEYEPDILRRCRARGIKVPEVVADSRGSRSTERGYLVYKMLPGVSLETRLERLSARELTVICAGITEQLKKLSSLSITGFGELVSDEHARSVSWYEFVQEAFTLGLKAARREGLLPIALINELTSIGSRLDRFTGPGRSILAWGDLSPRVHRANRELRYMCLCAGCVCFSTVKSPCQPALPGTRLSNFCRSSIPP
jgi:hypothetical protein